MAKTIVLKAQVDGMDKVEKTVNAFADLRKSVKDAKAELLKFDVGTAEFDKAQRKLGELTDKMGDLRDATKINGTGMERLSASFGLFRESISNGDIDKLKLSFDGLKGAMAALPMFALVQGITLLIQNWDKVSEALFGVTDQTKKNKEAMEALEKQQAANKKVLDDYIDSLNKQLEVLALTNGPLANQLALIKKRTDVQVNAIDEEIKKKKEEIAVTEQSIATNQKQLEQTQLLSAGVNLSYQSMVDSANQQLEATLTIQQQELASLEKLQTDKTYVITKGEDDLYKKKLEAWEKANALRQAEYEHWKYWHNRRLAEEASEIAAEEYLKNQSEKTKQENIQETMVVQDSAFLQTLEFGNAQFKFEQQADKRAKNTLQSKLNALKEERDAQLASVGNTESASKAKSEIELQYVDKVKQAKKQAYDEELTMAKQVIQVISSSLNVLSGLLSQFTSMQSNSARQELQSLQNKSAQQLAAFEYNKDLRLQAIEDEKNQTLNTLADQYNQQMANQQLSADQRSNIEATYNKKVADTNKKAQRAKILADNQAAKAKYDLDLAIFKSEQEAKKKAFESGKKLQIANTVLQTISGAVAAFTGMVASIPGPAGLIAGGLASGAVTAMGFRQIAELRKQEFEGATAPAKPILPSVNLENEIDGGSGAGPSARPNRATLFSTGQSQQIGIVPGQNGAEKPLRAYVVSTDITTQQQLDASIKSKSQF